MKTYAIRVLALIVVSALALSGCVVTPAPAPEASPATTPGETSPSQLAGEWQTYTDAQVGFSIEYPSTWSSQTLPD